MSRISVRGVMLSSVAGVLSTGIVAAGMAASPVPSAAAGVVLTSATGPSVPSVGTQLQLERAAGVRVDQQRAAAAAAAARAHAAAVHHAQLVAVRRAAAAAAAAAQAAAAQRAAELAAYASESPQAVAQGMLGQYGWDDATQWSCLDNLWERESSWNVHAENPSGAYGIPQALPGSKMAAEGADWQDNPATQIRWGLWYISVSYGTPCAAWDHDTAYGFY